MDNKKDLSAAPAALDLDDVSTQLSITRDALQILYRDISSFYDSRLDPDAHSVASVWASGLYILEDKLSQIQTDLDHLIDAARDKNRGAAEAASQGSPETK